jgi:hypothetical protein
LAVLLAHYDATAVSALSAVHAEPEIPFLDLLVAHDAGDQELAWLCIAGEDPGNVLTLLGIRAVPFRG